MSQAFFTGKGPEDGTAITLMVKNRIPQFSGPLKPSTAHIMENTMRGDEAEKPYDNSREEPPHPEKDPGEEAPMRVGCGAGRPNRRFPAAAD